MHHNATTAQCGRGLYRGNAETGGETAAQKNAVFLFAAKTKQTAATERNEPDRF